MWLRADRMTHAADWVCHVFWLKAQAGHGIRVQHALLRLHAVRSSEISEGSGNHSERVAKQVHK
jgi:hypothetical protein